MNGFAPEELVAILRSLQASGWDAILVGGQAVNVWAGHYERAEPAWRELRPYTSCNLVRALPLDDMRAAEGFAAFFQQRLPQLIDKVTRKRERHLEILRQDGTWEGKRETKTPDPFSPPI